MGRTGPDHRRAGGHRRRPASHHGAAQGRRVPLVRRSPRPAVVRSVLRLGGGPAGRERPVTAPLLVDVDLRAEQAVVLGPGRPVHALVWWGDRVLGERVVRSFDGPPRDVRAELLAGFVAEVAAMEAVTAASSPLLVEPGEVTVVVCTRDRPQHLAGCLAALHELDPAPAEILVVDNASCTGSTSASTSALAQEWGLRRVVEPVGGLARARNTGWRSARTPVVAFTDDDARPHPHWVGALARGFSGPSVGCVTGLVVAAELMTPAQRELEARRGMKKGFRPQLFSGTGMGADALRLGAGVNMAFRREVLDRIGGFDVRLGPGSHVGGGDDVDAFLRVMAAGAAVAYEPSAVVRHIHPRDLPGLLERYHADGAGYGALLRKHELTGSDGGAGARRERARWHRQRHGSAVAAAVRRRDLRRLVQLVA